MDGLYFSLPVFISPSGRSTSRVREIGCSESKSRFLRAREMCPMASRPQTSGRLTVGHSCTLFPLHTNSDHVPILQDKYREYQSHATQDYERGSKMDRLRLHSDIPMVLDSTCITLRRPPPLRMKLVTPIRCNVFTRSIHESEQLP